MSRIGRSQPANQPYNHFLWPPRAVLPVPLQREQTVRVTLAAVNTRRDLKRRVPPMWLEPSGTKTTTGAIQTFGAFEPALGPMPPQLVLGIPALRDRTTFVWTLDPAEKQRLRQAIKTRSRLSPPATLSQPLTLAQQTITVRLASRVRRHDWRYYPLSAYYGPTVVNPPPAPPVETTLRVHYVRQVRRSAQRALYPPVTTTPFVPPGAPYAVTTLKKVLVPRRHDWRRQVLHILFAPAVVSLRPPVVTHLRTSLVPRRTNQRYKATHFYRGPMVVGAPPPPVTGQPTRMLMGVGT